MANQLVPVITNAGREALMSGFSRAENFRFSHVALGDGSGEGYYPNPGDEVLKNEIQRVDISSVIIQDHARLHITAVVGAPDNQDIGEYNIHEIGFFLQGIDQDGKASEAPILFALYATEPGKLPLLVKDPQTELLLAFDLVLPDVAEGELKFDKDSYLHLPVATQTVAGMLQIASKDEVLAGDAGNKAVSPSGLKFVLEQYKPTASGGGQSQSENLVVNGTLAVGTDDPGISKFMVKNSKDDCNNVYFATPGAGQLESRAWSDGWNIQTMTDAKHLFINRDSKESSDVYVGRQGKELFVQGKNGRVGIGTNNPTSKLDVSGHAHISKTLKMDKDQEILFADNGQIRSLDNNHRILFRREDNALELREYGKIVFSSGATKGTETAQAVLLPNGDFQVKGKITAASIDVAGHAAQASYNPNHHRMYPEQPIVYQDIFDAVKKGAIKVMGKPMYDDKTYTSKNPWNGKTIIKFGSDNETDGNGAMLEVPAGYDTVWIRVLGDRWTVMKAYFLDGAKEDCGLWSGGYRSSNGYCPDGSLSDGHHNGENDDISYHQWVPIAVQRSGKLALVVKPKTNSHFWVSGVAFSKNPWGHAGQSAVSYHWRLNGGSDVSWHNHNWHRDVLAQLDGAKKTDLLVPVVANGRDKLLYLIEHNNDWNGCMHTGISVNGKLIERFLATYDNPFARHWNGKYFQRYLAARIPENLMSKNDKWLKVQIDMTGTRKPIYFREIGSHDLLVPSAE